MTVEINIQRMRNCVDQLGHSSNIKVVAELESIKGSLEDAINQANMIEKYARGIQGELNDLYKRLVDPAGWNPDAVYGFGTAPPLGALANPERQAIATEAPPATPKRQQDQTVVYGDMRCDGCGDCRGGDGPCSKT